MNWRGPTLNGVSSASNLPSAWSIEKNENIGWVADIDGAGSSTPIVVDGMIYLSAEGSNHELLAICIDSRNGEIAWQRQVGVGRKAARNNMASPSPTSDGEGIYFLFGEGTLVGFSRDGKELWTRNLEAEHGKFSQKFGYSSSPLLYNGRLYITMMRRKSPDSSSNEAAQSWLMALDPATGETLWKQQRPTDAKGESKDSYITPVVGRNGIILVGADLVTCNDPENGEELWRYDLVPDKQRETNWRIISSPVVANDLVVTPYPRGGKMIALKLPPSGGSPEKAWEHKGRIPDVCTSAVKDDLLYVLDGKRRYLSCFDLFSGERIWQEQIESGGGFYASPTIADGKIYCIDRKGEIFVWKTGRKAKLLEKFSLDEKDCNATIVAVGSSLYIRTPSRLICARL